MSKWNRIFSKSKLFFLQWLLIFHILAVIQAAFRDQQLDLGINFCPHQLCDDGNKSFLCAEEEYDYEYYFRDPCPNFELIKLTNTLRRTFLEGHNGIRNKVAKDFGITNMNLVYWNNELEKISNLFLEQCLIKRDICHTVGSNDVPIYQNIIYSKNILGQRWPGAVVRRWYLQLGFKIKTFDDFVEHRTSAMDDFTQMIWPVLRFIGCGAARMFDGYVAVCYYNPPFEKNKLEYLASIIRGDTECGNCPDSRPTCSLVFKRLCGVDIDQFNSAINLFSFNSAFIFIIIILYNLSNFLIK